MELIYASDSRFWGATDTQTIQNAIDYAKELKDRYTVLWLYYDFYGENGHV